MTKIYPLTIIHDRYAGTYSGGLFTAWNLYPNSIPSEICDDDSTCAFFWGEFKSGKTELTNEFGEHVRVGLGGSPNESLEGEAVLKRDYTYLNLVLTEQVKDLQYWVNKCMELDFLELRGKDLCCWCPIGSPCHAEILLRLANR